MRAHVHVKSKITFTEHRKCQLSDKNFGASWLGKGAPPLLRVVDMVDNCRICTSGSGLIWFLLESAPIDIILPLDSQSSPESGGGQASCAVSV